MPRLIMLLGLAGVVALVVPAVAASREKARRERDGDAAIDESANEIDLAAIFDTVNARSTARAFRGGDILVWYGTGTLDLREATLDPAGAHLRVRTMFGGLELIVPRSWPVELDSRSILGGVGDARDPARLDPAAPTLWLDVQAMFGGVGVVDGLETDGLDFDVPVVEDAGAS